ncbi:hypothetical protein LVD15_06595 [Fulvivirga maritima]|uniref:DinB family protein n=1 Tax=Fulvivirga maritima TaxID=2904247 RepID=UPI001F34FC33|nr:DinB family protein [Fulvivirga maritima]UII28090.1 hypothetical protein LVD15_06595 [Fulvivirga maritima]
MKKHFLDLFRYNEWANNRLLITLEDSQVKDDKIMTLFSHLLSAQIIWINRIKDLPTSPFPLWEQYKLNEIKSMNEESNRNWRDLIEKHPRETFEEMIFYKNTKGTKYESTLREIISHVLNHSTYHRGQVMSRLRELDFAPPVTDYIAYCRQK